MVLLRGLSKITRLETWTASFFVPKQQRLDGCRNVNAQDSKLLARPNEPAPGLFVT